ncbi:hypothetical protein C1Y63_04380 [Corynebacterium sp. 13CS0277]|uniref:ALF repeat-containing protein n=1 Tax=Corynebacterium sp. 13CS0277 TaxID=2071994 RepID=UPI000D0285D5|nr:ALF repeat-containing protein [Corynebacterium sp. 13CS0277]PRQ11881.1 hypothetical protein C1Y63_04380 [Corynebacterium sp. 13CS0277]
MLRAPRVVTALVAVDDAAAAKRVRERLPEIKTDLARSGTVEEINEFINNEVEQLQLVGARDHAREILSRDTAGDTTLGILAEEALAADAAGDPEPLLALLSDGDERARAIDNERQLYELTDAEGPALRRAAEEVLLSGDAEAYDAFLSYGRYIAMLHDVEEEGVAAWADIVDQYTESAIAAADEAEFRARRAADLADTAAAAAARAQEHADHAVSAAHEAGDLANHTSRLANAAAAAADEASAAADEAAAALAQALDATSAAGALAAATERYAAEALAEASAARLGRGGAEAARDAAVKARDAASAARRARESSRNVAAVVQAAGQSRMHANSAAAAADRSAAAASHAADAAAGTSVHAQAARAAAGRSSQAAARARASAGRVDAFVAEIRSTGARVEALAAEAESHALAAAEEADAATQAAHAADAEATQAQALADAAAEAATRAETAAGIARDISQAARTLREQATIQQEDLIIAEASARAEAEEAERRENDAKISTQEELDALHAEWLAVKDSGEEATRRAEDLVFAALLSTDTYLSYLAQETISRATPRAYEFFAARLYDHAGEYINEIRALTIRETTDDPAVAERLAEAQDSTPEDLAAALDEHPLGYAAARARVTELAAAAARTAEQARATGDEDRAASADFELERWNELLAAEPKQITATMTGEGLQSFVAELGHVEGYNNLDADGPHQRLAATKAVYGSSDDAVEYWTAGRQLARMLDGINAQSEARVAALHGRIDNSVAESVNAAARAQQSAAQARHDAIAAAEHAEKARAAAQTAADAAASAQASLEQARRDLARAQQAQAQAHSAAARAERDAQAATAAAQTATNYEIASAAAAARAQEAAAQAREDANYADLAANEADIIRVLALKEEAEWVASEARDYQDEVEVGNIERPSFYDALKEAAAEVAPELQELMLDLLGITEAEECFEGESAACLSSLVNFVPVGKAVKLIKALPKFKKIFGVAKNAYNKRRNHEWDYEDIAGCIIPIRRPKRDIRPLIPCYREGEDGEYYDQNNQRVEIAIRDDDVVIDRKEGNLHIYEVDGKKLRDIKDWEVSTMWRPQSGLERPQRHDGTPMTEEEADRLRHIVQDVSDVVLPKDMFYIVPRESVNRRTEDRLLSDSKAPKSRSFDEDGNLVPRRVARDPVQNATAIQIQQNASAALEVEHIRADQRLFSKTHGGPAIRMRTRPDLQILYNGGEPHHDVNVFEFDSGRAPRQMRHIIDSATGHFANGGSQSLDIAMYNFGLKDIDPALADQIVNR